MQSFCGSCRYGGDSADYGGYGTPGMQQTNGYADVAAYVHTCMCALHCNPLLNQTHS